MKNRARLLFIEITTFVILNEIIKQYLGIPYAEPPVGNLRFAKLKPLEKPIEVSR